MADKKGNISDKFAKFTGQKRKEDESKLYSKQSEMHEQEDVNSRQMKIASLYKEYFHMKETFLLQKLKKLLKKSNVPLHNASATRKVPLCNEPRNECNSGENSGPPQLTTSDPLEVFVISDFHDLSSKDPPIEILTDAQDSSVRPKTLFLEKNNSSVPLVFPVVPPSEKFSATAEEGVTHLEAAILTDEEMDEWDKAEYNWRYRFDSKKIRFRVLLLSFMVFMCILLLSIPHVPERILGIRSPERVLELFAETQTDANGTIAELSQNIHNETHPVQKRHIPHKFWARVRPHNKFRKKKKQHKPKQDGQVLAVKPNNAESDKKMLNPYRSYK